MRRFSRITGRSSVNTQLAQAHLTSHHIPYHQRSCILSHPTPRFLWVAGIGGHSPSPEVARDVLPRCSDLIVDVHTFHRLPVVAVQWCSVGLGAAALVAVSFPLEPWGRSYLQAKVGSAHTLINSRFRHEPRRALNARSTFQLLAVKTALTTPGSILGNASLRVFSDCSLGFRGRGGCGGAASTAAG